MNFVYVRLREKQDDFLKEQRDAIHALQNTLLKMDHDFKQRLKQKEEELLEKKVRLLWVLFRF